LNVKFWPTVTDFFFQIHNAEHCGHCTVLEGVDCVADLGGSQSRNDWQSAMGELPHSTLHDANDDDQVCELRGVVIVYIRLFSDHHFPPFAAGSDEKPLEAITAEDAHEAVTEKAVILELETHLAGQPMTEQSSHLLTLVCSLNPKSDSKLQFPPKSFCIPEVPVASRPSCNSKSYSD
jgi:hypothetical protein